MFAMRPSNPYFGFQRPGMMPQYPQGQPGMPPQMTPPQMAPQGTALQQPGQPGMPGQPGGMQLSPQLLAQLAQLHGMGLGGRMGLGGPQMPTFGRPPVTMNTQPITSGAYSMR